MIPSVHLDRSVRKAERRWKKDHLTVSLKYLELPGELSEAARKARAKLFSDIISKYSHTPKILFSTINSIINPRTYNEAEPSADICERFLSFFVEKIDGFRSSLILLTLILCLNVQLIQSHLIAFSQCLCLNLRNLVMQMKSTPRRRMFSFSYH